MGLKELPDVVHIVPLSSPKFAGIKLKNGDSKSVKWTDILKIYEPME